MTKQEVKNAIALLITDPLNKQNTAAKVRESLGLIIDNLTNSPIKVSVPYTDLQPNATDQATLILDSLPAGAVPINWKMKITETFDAAGFTGLYGIAQLRSNILEFSGQLQLGSNPANDNSGAFGPAENASFIPDQANPSDLILYFDIGDDGETVTFDDLTAGAIDVWVWYVDGTI